MMTPPTPKALNRYFFLLAILAFFPDIFGTLSGRKFSYLGLEFTLGLLGIGAMLAHWQLTKAIDTAGRIAIRRETVIPLCRTCAQRLNDHLKEID